MSYQKIVEEILKRYLCASGVLLNFNNSCRQELNDFSNTMSTVWNFSSDVRKLYKKIEKHCDVQ